MGGERERDHHHHHHHHHSQVQCRGNYRTCSATCAPPSAAPNSQQATFSRTTRSPAASRGPPRAAPLSRQRLVFDKTKGGS
jgi:hypothetical protein